MAGQAQRCRPCQQLLDTADAELGTATDLADGQAAGKPSLSTSRILRIVILGAGMPPPKGGELTKAIESINALEDSG